MSAAGNHASRSHRSHARTASVIGNGTRVHLIRASRKRGILARILRRIREAMGHGN